MQVDLEDMYSRMNNAWEDIHFYQNQLWETEDQNIFESVVDELTTAYQKKRKLQKNIDGAEESRRAAEEARGALGWIVGLAELKTESDYRAQFVKRLNEEVAKEEKGITAAKGTDDEDLITSQNTAVIEWYK
jgi:hypothetical protein